MVSRTTDGDTHVVPQEGGLAVIVALLRAALGATPPTPGAVVPRSVEALLSVLASLVAAHVHNRDALFQADTLPLLVKLLNAAPPAGDAGEEGSPLPI